MTTIFDHALRVYRTPNFDFQMKKLRKIHKKAYRYLIEADVHKWSCEYCPVRHYSLMTTNVVKSMNSTLRHVRKLSITTLVKFVRDMIDPMIVL